MVTSLFRYERIKTTKAKALEIRRSAEKLITRAKVDSVHNRRIVSSRLFDDGIVAKLFTNIAIRMKERSGGYTRVLKLGRRYGDAAEVVILELVDYTLKIEDDSGKKEKKSKAGKKNGGGKVADRFK
jgi:large subunit ribosomal protein L17